MKPNQFERNAAIDTQLTNWYSKDLSERLVWLVEQDILDCESALDFIIETLGEEQQASLMETLERQQLDNITNKIIENLESWEG